VSRLVTLAVVAGLALAASSAAAVKPVTFPRDHFGHPAASIEWWYFTALAEDVSGTQYSVFFTLFSSRGGLIAVSQVANLATGAVVGHTEEVALGKVSTSSLAVGAGRSRLGYVRRTNSWSFSVDTPEFGVSLTQRPTKPYARHGGTGVIQQGAAGPSRYYSATRMTATGMLRAGGRTLRLTGQSWLDHQWGNYRDDPRAFNWDWFSCRFDDGSELMLYQFRDRTTGRSMRSSTERSWRRTAGRPT
jgi:predicted secreted hydrolase